VACSCSSGGSSSSNGNCRFAHVQLQICTLTPVPTSHLLHPDSLDCSPLSSPSHTSMCLIPAAFHAPVKQPIHLQPWRWSDKRTSATSPSITSPSVLPPTGRGAWQLPHNTPTLFNPNRGDGPTPQSVMQPMALQPVSHPDGGKRLTTLAASVAAPAPSSFSTTSACPSAAASCRGVQPFCSSSRQVLPLSTACVS
jgi:hypothetical protein